MPLNFESKFRISILTLRFNGIHPNSRRDIKWIIKFSISNVISYVVIFFLVNSIIYHDIPNGKYVEAIRNGCIVIVSIAIPFDNFIALYYRKQIKNYIKTINKDYSAIERCKTEEKQIVLQYSIMGTKVCKYWLFSVSITTAMFPFKALCLMTSSYVQGEFNFVHMFDITYPELIEVHKDVGYVYVSLFVMSLIFAIYASMVYIGFDPLIPIFTIHVCGQIEILNRRLTSLVEVTNTKEILENLRNINIKLQELYNFINAMRSNFMALFEFQMRITIFMMPFAFFQIVQSLSRFEINVEFTALLISCTIHFFMLCYYGNFLMVKGMQLREAIYCCGWENHSNTQIRKAVLLMLTRCNNLLSIRSVFYPINLATFSEACRQAYAIFSIMHATWS